jgi:hypothetical protein
MACNGLAAESLGLRILEYIRVYNENLNADKKTGDVVSSILAACRELEACVAPPEVWTLQVATAHHRTTALCLLLDWEIPKLLSEGGGAMSLDKLVEVSGISESLLRMYCPYRPWIIMISGN